MHVYREIGGGAIFLLAIASVITRSRRINEATAAAVGAAAILGFGVLSPAQALATLVVGASVDRREQPGPHSDGHTARFVLDHSSCPVLLIRGQPAD